MYGWNKEFKLQNWKYNKFEIFLREATKRLTTGPCAAAPADREVEPPVVAARWRPPLARDRRGTLQASKKERRMRHRTKNRRPKT